MKSILRSYQGLFIVALAGAFACSLTGCGSGTPPPPPPVAPPQPPPVPPPPPVTNPGVSFTGKAMAGSQPIVGATVQVYATGTSGNGSASVGLLTNTLITDATGAFTVPGGYACPQAASQIYVVVRGGQVGTNSNNPAISLASALGACNQIAVSSSFVVNEVTTAVTAWGLSQFFGGEGNLGASSTNAQGLANAVATVANLVNLTTGASPGLAFPTTGTSPAARINTVADLLDNCTTAASNCGPLFSATRPAGGSAPDNTLDAALNLVRNPGSNVATLFAQLPATALPFKPALGAAPADWTLFINYKGGGMHLPSGLGVDSTGNVWVASYSSVASKFSTTGAPLFPSGITSGGLLNSYALAVDPQDDVWIPDEESPTVNGNFGSVTVLNSAGNVISGATGFSAGGLSYPKAIAIDTNGTVWLTNYGDSTVTLLSSAGQPLSGAKGYASLQFGFPLAVAIDANHNGWVANFSNDTVSRVSPDGSQITSYACCSGPDGVAIDQRGYVWVANQYGNSISELSSDGSVISSGYSDNKASIVLPQGLTIDGSGHVWIANLHGNSITELAGSAASSHGQILSPTAGYAADAGLKEAYAIVVDASGNLWVTDFNNDTLTEIVGLATPVKTPALGPPQAP